MIKKIPVAGSLLLLSVFLVHFAAFAASNPTPVFVGKPAGDSEGSSSYIIGAQNLLQIKIFGEADVNQMYRVDEDGYVKHTLAGRVKVGGLTVTEAEKLLEQKLDGDYIINPQINIFVLEYSRFSILGEVRKPGNYELTGKMSVIRAISLAGGFTPIANQRGVQIIRKQAYGAESRIGVDAVKIMEGNSSSEQELQADDVVVIPKSFF
jgi:polysaccharide export outer membrane protein